MICISTGYDDWKPVVSFSSEDLILVRAVRDEIKVIPIDVFGIRSFCCMRSGYFEIMADESTIQTLLLSFYNYVHELLGPSPEYQLSVEAEGFLPKIKHVSVTKLHLRQCPTASELEEYFSCSPNQECIFFKTWAQFEFMKQSKICYTKNLKFDCLGQPTDQILTDFNGRSLVLERTSIKESTIIQFVNQWRSNRKYQNLEFVHFNLFRGSYDDPLELLEEIGVKENGLAIYHFKNRLNIDSKSITSIKQNSWHHVVNESTGHVATISIGNDQFHFAALRITEKEFLARHPIPKMSSDDV